MTPAPLLPSHRHAGRRRTPLSGALLFSLLGASLLIACAQGETDELSEGSEKSSGAQRRDTLLALQRVAAARGLHDPTLIAGVANAETGLAHCWRDATWSCKGPASQSCGGGAVVAGSGDGACSRQQGGLGLFQLDAGTYRQTIAREGSGVLTLDGNINAGVDFILNMIRQERGLSSDAAAVDWLNGVSVGGARYDQWITLVVERYNGCVQGSCSIFRSRWRHYDSKTRDVMTEVARLPRVSSAWVGSACVSDDDCDFSTEDGVARCLKGSAGGVCVTACEGYCPDRAGFSATFCAVGAQVGDAAASGLCVAQSSGGARPCAASGAVVMSAERHVGSSSASARRAEVCAPAPLASQPTPAPEPTPAPPATSLNGDLCDDPSLPPSAASCSAADEGVWRCACHARYAVTTSQVCRDGSWLNYRLEPSDCARCSGSSSSGCD